MREMRDTTLTPAHYSLLATYADGRPHIWDATSLTGLVLDLESAHLIDIPRRDGVDENPWAYQITDRGREVLAANPETERHDYEAGDATHPMHTDPLCRVCGRPARDRIHD